MKKILILVDKIGPKKELFAELVAQRLAGKDVRIVLARFSDLYFEIDGKYIKVAIEGTALAAFDLVYFRRAGDKFSGVAATLACYLKERRIKYIDTAWSEIGPLGSKFTSVLKLAMAGLPVFPTIMFGRQILKNTRIKLSKNWGFPWWQRSFRCKEAREFP